MVQSWGGWGVDKPPTEISQASQELPHLVLKMFDSGRNLVQLTSRCSAAVRSCCVNIPSLCNTRTRQRNKGTSVLYSFKQAGSFFEFFSECSF